ncbi:MAG: hypothetical protein LBM77_12465 [Spirochaetaceae bacterium]|jgi:beta-mannosidase|nr:hypothetical protein [Spirochaetaceae bacterium]
MLIVDLASDKKGIDSPWTLREEGGGIAIPGFLPGNNIADLLAAGLIQNPYYKGNEHAAWKISKKDWAYSRSFILSPQAIDAANLDLVLSGIDTLAEIRINNTIVANTDNAFRVWRFPIKKYVSAGLNTISITLRSPLALAGEQGFCAIRKPAYHFESSFMPPICPAGLSSYIRIESYDARIADIKIKQIHSHQTKNVELEIEASFSSGLSGQLKPECFIEDPNGFKQNVLLVNKDNAHKHYLYRLNITNPELWWCRDMGAQPLYTVSVELQDSTDTVIESIQKKIGLRSIEVDTSPVEGGANFGFIINGLPLFVKGAVWFPLDSPAEAIDTACEANLNMLRVSGSTFYESDAFYDLCDEKGLLVWQDFPFTASKAGWVYPFGDCNFLNTVEEEVKYNLLRLQHHPSLVIWCGNNELENAVYRKTDAEFFYRVLSSWVNKYDGTHFYWPGSPSSGIMPLRKGACVKSNSFLFGDTHIQKLRRSAIPRFCSDFSIKPAAKLYQVEAFEKAMLNVRSLTINNKRICNGIIFFSLKDYLASSPLFYRAREFNKNSYISIEKTRKQCSLYLINDTQHAYSGKLKICIRDFSGNLIFEDKARISSAAHSSELLYTLDYKNALIDKDKRSLFLSAILSDEKNNTKERTTALVRDLFAKYVRPDLRFHCKETGKDQISITVSSDTFARAVCIESVYIEKLSNNYFNIKPGESMTVQAKVSTDIESLEKSIRLSSFGSPKARKRLLLAWLSYTFFLPPLAKKPKMHHNKDKIKTF